MFRGEYSQKMDTKGRTIVPAKFREELNGSIVVTRGLDGCLFAYSKEAWEAL
ncbi:MAG: division/cell wall cluster transcriptional repressor MraZ, partial [Eubacterium sp.]|nr:division/cell wall cluster transcriptional repressor MraZ [Eubacterium sp.]